VRKFLILTIGTLWVLCVAGSASAQVVDVFDLNKISSRYLFAERTGSADEKNLRFLYVDQLSHVHVYRIGEKGYDLDWEVTNLGSRTSSIFVTDLFQDGGLELVISTWGGRILVYDWKTYDLEWENLQDNYREVSYMIAHNVDDDPQQELIFIAGKRLFIYDSLRKNVEWVSQEEYNPKQLLVANVDNDPQPEIIMDTGVVLDSRFYNVDILSQVPFGENMSLMDINNDGIPEVFGRMPDNRIRVYDFYAEREIW